MILVTKQLIYANKCQKKRVSFRNVLHKINELYLIESYNALKQGKVSHHKRKWYPYVGEQDNQDNAVVSDYIQDYIEQIDQVTFD